MEKIITPDQKAYWQPSIDAATSQYGQNSIGGPSMWDSFRNANAGIQKAKSSINMPDDVRNELIKPLRQQKLQAGIGMGLQGMQLATNTLTGMQNAMQLADTSQLDSQIADRQGVGMSDYGDFSQIQADRALLDENVDIDEDEIRGMTNGQKWGSIGTAGLSGFATGMQMTGNPLIAGAIGLGTAALQGGAVLYGDKLASIKADTLNNDLTRANNIAADNLHAATERLRDRQNRNLAVNAVRRGGQIDRKQALREYADKIFSNGRRSGNHYGGIERKYVKGGLAIRIRMPKG